MAFILASAIELIRKSLGMTQGAFAALVGVKQVTVSKWEASAKETEISEERLQAICNATGFLRGFFSYPNYSIKLAYRQNKTGSVKERNRLEARLTLIGMLLSSISRSDNAATPWKGFSRPGEPLRAAISLRKSLGFGDGPIKSVLEIYEYLKIPVYPFNFEGVFKTDAVTLFTESGPIVLIQTHSNGDRISGERQRITLAHELGHILIDKENSQHDENEDYAWLFAGELLAPTSQIAEYLQDISLRIAIELKMYWMISIAALYRRAKEHGFISEERYRQLHIQLCAMGIRYKEPSELDPEFIMPLSSTSIPKACKSIFTDELAMDLLKSVSAA